MKSLDVINVDETFSNNNFKDPVDRIFFVLDTWIIKLTRKFALKIQRWGIKHYSCLILVTSKTYFPSLYF